MNKSQQKLRFYQTLCLLPRSLFASLVKAIIYNDEQVHVFVENYRYMLFSRMLQGMVVLALHKITCLTDPTMSRVLFFFLSLSLTHYGILPKFVYGGV